MRDERGEPEKNSAGSCLSSLISAGSSLFSLVPPLSSLIMRIAQVIGKVTLLRGHPSLRGASFKIVVPLTREGLAGDVAGRTEPLVMFDALGAGEGSMVALSESAEAAAPFHPDTKPVDAYNAAILDSINLEGRHAGA